MRRNRINGALLAVALFAAAPPAPAAAQAEPAAEAATSDFEADRQSILAMAGDYRVRFDMRETTSWRDDYTPLDPALSGGFESVRVIEDSGRHIVLQHILVVGAATDPVVVKHWRQDWTYEPANYLAYEGEGRWTLEPVPESERAGSWSQTVWQVDDSPRYGGYGRWTEEGGVRRWQSNEIWRPLARRDATRGPRYDRYLSVNRHASAPVGWIHWQDNLKMGLIDGQLEPFVQESVLNTYAVSADFDPSPAMNYWEHTQGYWAAVREAWDEAIEAHDGVTLIEEPQMGNTISETLYDLGLQVDAGEIDEAAAIAQARETIRTATDTAVGG